MKQIVQNIEIETLNNIMLGHGGHEDSANGYQTKELYLGCVLIYCSSTRIVIGLEWRGS